ncbi:hypothetical protein P691DRAFT_758391 [Macrolepiota fuliginosa MF-IS2]|uniref:Uncharacterized protein n=1 Tax=Macrolepiota fuliginosa MF-IS2 TaxID=1400762 RepID=A0A9P5XGE5_9AGAR|nr:hypothetical protein P691DRAFT_758391 [Macrolepiota fuliginosa MF-IS2]
MSVSTPAASKGVFSGSGVKALFGTTTRTTSTTVTITSTTPPFAAGSFAHSHPSSSFVFSSSLPPPPPPSPSPFSSINDSNQDPSSPAPDPNSATETPNFFPAPTPTPSDTTPTSASAIVPETTSSTEALPFEAETSTPISSDFIVSTILSASTDSTLGVHTFTQVTTIASFRALPSQNVTNPNRDTRSTDGSSSPNVGVIIMGIMGGLVVCALSLLAIYWYRRRGRRPPSYEFAGYSSVARTPKSPTWERRFDSAWARRLHETGSFGGSSRERITTPTPFRGTRNLDASAEKLSLSTVPRVIFQEVSRDDEGVEVMLRDREGPSQRDRPPTYYTYSTGGATIATTLPLYSAYDPSPISEWSELPDTPTTITSHSPLIGRGKPRRSRRGNPLTPIGEKF